MLNSLYSISVAVLISTIAILVIKLFHYKKKIIEKDLKLIQFYLDKKFIINKLTKNFELPNSQKYPDSFFEDVKFYFKLDDIRIISVQELEKDKEHELKLINLQIEAAKANRHSKLEAVKLQTEAEESKYLYLHAAPSKVKWVDGLAALVRPLVTFMFVLSYIYFKHKYQGTLAWTEEDQGIFNTVICFWFGNRAVNKYKK